MNYPKQQGFSLFMVMILMLVIAFLVIVTSQSSLTEMRMSSNEADRKMALARAETGLREAEMKIESIVNNNTASNFTDACLSGLCQPAKGSFDANRVNAPFAYSGSSASTIEAWHRCAANVNQNCRNKAGQTVLDSGNNRILTADGMGAYIIEYLGVSDTNNVEKETFRITSKATGDNQETQAVLQAYIELTR